MHGDVLSHLCRLWSVVGGGWLRGVPVPVAVCTCTWLRGSGWAQGCPHSTHTPDCRQTAAVGEAPQGERPCGAGCRRRCCLWPGSLPTGQPWVRLSVPVLQASERKRSRPAGLHLSLASNVGSSRVYRRVFRHARACSYSVTSLRRVGARVKDDGRCGRCGAQQSTGCVLGALGRGGSPAAFSCQARQHCQSDVGSPLTGTGLCSDPAMPCATGLQFGAADAAPPNGI